MKLLIVLSGLAAIALAAPTVENTLELWPTTSKRFLGRIINGEVAAHNSAAFICSMRFGIKVWQHSCGGSVLSPWWFLTAASCITGLPNAGTVQIQCGVTNRAVDFVAQQLRNFHRVNHVFLHPGWIAGSGGPDNVALIRVSQAFVLNDVVQPIRLRTAGVVDSGVARIFGWGAIDNNTPTHTVPLDLRTAEKDLITMADCEARLGAINTAYLGRVRDTNICAARGQISACGGDTGGPLVVGTPGNWVQVGIVSWGLAPCGIVPGAPSVYARTSAYIQWISSVTNLDPSQIT